jgi:predicted phage tail protein
MLKKVILYGELADKFGKEWSLDINSPGEAFRALDVNNIGFRQFVASSEERGVGYRVMVGKSYINDYSELGHPSGRQEIKVIPVVLGAGRASKAIGMILLGALLIWQPWAAPEVMGAMSAAEGTAALSSGALSVSGGFVSSSTYSAMAMKLGGALLLGGIASLLSPTPELPDGDKPTNYAFDGATNTARQGYAIPVCYGQLLVGGTVISSGVSPEDYRP